MNIRSRLRLVVALFVLSLLLLGSSLVLSERQRTEHFARLTTALDADRVRSDTTVCVEDLQLQISLTAQTIPFGDGAAGLDATTRRALLAEIARCRIVSGQLQRGWADDGTQPLSTRVGALLDHWLVVVQQLGTARHNDALMTLALKADPSAQQLTGTLLPDAKTGYTAAVDEARLAFDRSSQTGDLLVILVGCLALVATGLVLVTVLSLDAGLRALLTGATAYRTGRLHHKIPTEGAQEFGEVAAQMNEMASAIIEAQSELESRARRLERSLEDLRRTQAQLVEQQKMAALGTLVAGVAHEVNTPLGVAITANSYLNDNLGSLQTLLQDADTQPHQVQEVVDLGLEATHLLTHNLARAAELVRSFKQVAVDRSHRETRRLRLGGWLDAVAHSLSPLMRRHGVHLSVHADIDAQLELSAGELEQVLTNLCVNSVHHGYPDGAAGARAEGDPHVQIGSTVQDDALLIEVSDNGVGMPPEVVERVFEPFFTTRRGAGGTGLGLHIVHQVVTTAFQGHVEVTSQPGEGTRWQLRLPFGTDALRYIPPQPG